MFRNRNLLKAIAMSLLVRKRTNTNIIKNFTINKLAQITSMHAETVKKRLRTLKDYNLVSYNGKNLVLRSLVSKHKMRNVRLAMIAYNKIKDVERSLQAILVANIQLNKDFVKRTIRTAHNGHDYKQVKAAQKLSRKYNWGHDYVDYGLGYKKIAKTISCCKVTAEKIVKFAQKIKILKKIKRCERIFLPNINYQDYEGCTFTTKNYGYIIKANQYEVAPCLQTLGLIRG